MLHIGTLFIYVTVGLFLLGFVTQRNMFCSSWYLACLFFAISCGSCNLSREWWFFVSNSAIITVTLNILPKRVQKATLCVVTLVKGAEPFLGSVSVRGLGYCWEAARGLDSYPLPSGSISVHHSGLGCVTLKSSLPPLRVVTFSGKP